MFNPITDTFNGFRICESDLMVVYAGEDWTKVRSKGRARRRRNKHRQNITALYKPSGQFIINEHARTIHCHPAQAAQLRSLVTSEVIQ